MNNIIGVEISPLKQIPDNRGCVREFIVSEPGLVSIYTTTVYRGVIKGWHGYYSKNLNYCVPIGLVKLVLFDNRKESPTYKNLDEVYVGEGNYVRVHIPFGVANAFQGIADTNLAVVACDEEFDESRMYRFPIENDLIVYDWSKVNR